MINNQKIKIFDFFVNNVDYSDLLHQIKSSIDQKRQICITGINVSTLNIVFEQKEIRKILESFDILHPDGIGLFLASRFLKNMELKKRITGSDFYLYLINEIKINKWEMFFFGDEDITLKRINKQNSELLISGLQNGFDYNTFKLVQKINESNTDILIVGMGAPKQEAWIYKNRNKLNVNVIIAVGDGIKMFAGNKIRGYSIVQKLGFEWFVRLINNPKDYWRRYIVGIPKFVFRFLKIEVLKNV